MLEYMDEAYSARACSIISTRSSISRLLLRPLLLLLVVLVLLRRINRFSPCKWLALRAHLRLVLVLLVLMCWVLWTRCVRMCDRMQALATLCRARHVLTLIKRRAPARQRTRPTRPTACRYTVVVSAFASAHVRKQSFV